jgi:hypothetical protein
MITYSWSIPQLEVAPSENGLDKVVKVVHWRLQADDGKGHTAEAYGTAPLAPPAEGAPFIDYDKIPKATVEEWLHAAIPEDAMEKLRAALAANIAAQIDPPVVTLSPPWVKA